MCIATFTTKAPAIKDDCLIANAVKVHLLDKIADAQSIKDIARDCSVSKATIQRVINQEEKISIL